MTKFSIIIPSRDITQYLKESIAHIKKQTFKNFELILVLDKQPDCHFNDERIKIVVSGSVGPGEKRNLGVENSSGEILAFLDDDAYPTDTWLEKADLIFKEKNVYALGGPALTPKNAKLFERVSGLVLESWLASGHTTFRHKISPERKVSDHPTVNLFVKKTVFNRVGGFDLKYWPGEDTKLCLDLYKTMKKAFLYSPDVVVYHHRRSIFLPHLKQISRYGKHRGRYAKIFPETSRIPWYFLPAAFVVFLVVGSVFSILYKPYLYIYLVGLSIYSAVLLMETIHVLLRGENLAAAMLFAVSVFLTHMVYGTNFIFGYLINPKLKLKNYNLQTGNYTEG